MKSPSHPHLKVQHIERFGITMQEQNEEEPAKTEEPTPLQGE